MRRASSAALVTLVVTSVLAASAALGTPAAADPGDRGPSGALLSASAPSGATSGPTGDLWPAAAQGGTGLDPDLVEADGEVAAFVQLAAPSAADVAGAGGDAAAVEAAEQHIEDLAAALVPAGPDAAAGPGVAAGTVTAAQEAEPDDQPDDQPEAQPDDPATPQRLSVTTNVLAGAVVRGDAALVRELAASPDVVGVHRIVPKRVMNSSTAVLTRTPDAWRSAGRTGEGVRVGVVDTGLDYTHATFGGPGTPEAFAQAYGRDGTGTYPADLVDPAKFLGGVDLAGPRYDAGGGPGTIRDPDPDLNPIDPRSDADVLGHGTHVAGTGFGYGVLPDGSTFRGDYESLTDLSGWRVGPGSAPGAGVFALKVVGDLGGTTELIIPALERAMDPDDDGDFSDHLDVVTVSLGEDRLPADDPESLFVERLADLGVLTVLAAGQAGDVTDGTGAPATARSGLTVAASVGDARLHDAVEVLQAPDRDVVGRHPAQSSTQLVVPDGDEDGGDVTAPVVFLGEDVTGCTPLTEFADRLAGAIVWLHWDDDPAARTCSSADRFDHAEDAGAVGVLVGTELPDFDVNLGGNASIPGAQLTAASTDRLLPLIRQGGVTMRLGPSLAQSQYVVDESLDETLFDLSPRGVHGSLGVVKPDVAAPGATILSARSGSGTGSESRFGTSMAAPHVAGIAALVRDVHPGWTPAQVKAAVMNTATRDVRAGQGDRSPVYGPLRVGSGRVDALDAVRTTTLAYATDDAALVSVTFGVVPVGDRVVTQRRTVTVENTGTRPVEYRTSFAAATTSGGARVTVSPETVTIAPGSQERVTLTLTVDPATLEKRLDPTSSPVVDGLGAPRDFLTAVSGRLVLQGADGELRVPVVAAPRLVSDLTAEPVVLPGAGAASAPLTVTGRGARNEGWTPMVAPLQLVATSPALPTSPSGGTSSAVAAGDLRAVGFASTAPQLRAAGLDPTQGVVGIGVATSGEWASLGSSSSEGDRLDEVHGAIQVDTDVDGDGRDDFRTVVRKFPGSDLTIAATYDAQLWVRGFDGVNGVGDAMNTTVFDSNVVVVPIPLATLGVAPGRTVTMSVSTWSPDVADPAGVLDSVGPFTVDPYAPEYWFDGGREPALLFDAAPGSPVTVHRDAAPGAPAPQLLVLHTLNAGPAARWQVVDVTAPAATPTTTVLQAAGTPAVGSPVRLTATVTPAGATGSVDLVDGDGTVLATAPVVGGQASATVRLGAGEHRVTARFTPDDPQWAASASEAVTVTVPQAASSVTFRLTDRAVEYGDLTTALVEVRAAAGTPSGTVEVLVGDAVVATGEVVVDGSTGTARVDLPRDVPVGGHRVTARYVGSTDVAPSDDWLRLRVTPADARVALSAPSWTVRPGSSPTVTVTLSGADGAPAPTGRVTVLLNLRRVGSADLGPDGTVTVTLPAVRRGGVVSAVYGGDDGYRPDVEVRALRVR
ncbi:S8 family serine peptidase [Cellulomonas aerilata]|uniref:Uncharacterized protein n=1 Tax=Cellulomonas aerilata TaxID=515326 RepID=A0A512DEL5_9CELL|nr:S8 family serine peptidase [Cellulomonas aerilata]GEO34909.1 hypothetical protein CAE01nite_26340 [Cellulomonas aerilata]